MTEVDYIAGHLVENTFYNVEQGFPTEDVKNVKKIS